MMRNKEKRWTWECIESMETGHEKGHGADSVTIAIVCLYILCLGILIRLTMHERFRDGDTVMGFGLHCQEGEAGGREGKRERSKTIAQMDNEKRCVN